MSERRAIEEAQELLDSYLTTSGKRRTAERNAVLRAVYGMQGAFTVAQVEDALDRERLLISRSTIYNSLRLFMQLRLVEQHRKPGLTEYEVSSGQGTCRMVCTLCGKERRLTLPQVEMAVEKARLPRFRRKSFSLTIFGVCSSCQAKLTRQSNLQKSIKG